MKRMVAIVEKTETGYCAYVPEFDFCGTVGDSMLEIRTGLIEAISLFLEDSPEKCADCLGEFAESMEFDFRMDISDFFQLHNPVKQSLIAKKAGINPSLLRQYARGIKHPGVNQALKIEKAIHQLGRELLQVRF
jgi:predicted RNase H-like HicB family nuclease